MDAAIWQPVGRRHSEACLLHVEVGVVERWARKKKKKTFIFVHYVERRNCKLEGDEEQPGRCR